MTRITMIQKRISEAIFCLGLVIVPALIFLAGPFTAAFVAISLPWLYWLIAPDFESLEREKWEFRKWEIEFRETEKLHEHIDDEWSETLGMESSAIMDEEDEE